MVQTQIPIPTPFADRKQIWIVQPRIEHYRVPVWDRLREQLSDRFDVHAFGPLQDGQHQSYGGPSRDYFHQVECEPFKKLGQTLYRWPGLAEALKSLPSEQRPAAIVVAANPRNATCWQIPKLGKQLGIGTVAWTKGHSFSGSLPNFVSDPLRRRFLKAYDQIICYGEATKTELTELGLEPRRMHVANNTIDTRRIFEEGDAMAKRGRELRQEYNLDNRRLLICIGRMDEDKRHRDLLEAWPQLAEFDPTLSMVLIGGGPLLEVIRSQAKEVDADRILVTGRVPEGDDYAWLAAAADQEAGGGLAIYPGAVGLAINQSLAIGCPTLIADEYGADGEIVKHGETGWRYTRGDLSAMTQQVKAIVTHTVATQMVIDEAREMMRSKITIQNMVDHIQEAILAAIASDSTRIQSS